MSLGRRIRQVRQSRGLTQSQLGGSELSKSFISLLEKDRTQPSVHTLVLIAQRLGTSVDSLLAQNGNIPEMVGGGLLAMSREAIRNRDFADAEKFLETVRFLTGRYGLDEAAREADLQKAQIHLEQRAFADAWQKSQIVLESSQQARDHWRVGRALLLMGRVKVRRRDFPEAVPLLERALTALRQARAGRDPARVETLIALGATLGYMGDYAAAIRRYQEAATSDVAQRDGKLRGHALWGIGLAQRKMGNHDAAREFLLKAKDAFEQAEELRDLTRVVHNLGQLLHEQGRPKEALRHFHQALRVAERLQRPVDRAATLTEIGRAYVSLGNLDDAEHFAEQALAEATRVNDPVEIAEAKIVLALVSVGRRDVPRAVDLLKEAVTTFQQRKMHAKMAAAARQLGLLLRARGAHAQAADFLALSLEQHSAAPDGRIPEVAESPE